MGLAEGCFACAGGPQGAQCVINPYCCHRSNTGVCPRENRSDSGLCRQLHSPIRALGESSSPTAPPQAALQARRQPSSTPRSANQAWVYSPVHRAVVAGGDALSTPGLGQAGCPPHCCPHPGVPELGLPLSPVTSHPRVPVLLSLHPLGGLGLRNWCPAPCWRGAPHPHVHAPPQLHLPWQPQVLALPPKATLAQGMGLLQLVPAAPPGSGCSWKSLWEQGNTVVGSVGWGELQLVPPRDSRSLPVTSGGSVTVPAAPQAPAEGAVAGEEDESQGEEQDLPGRNRNHVAPSGAGGHRRARRTMVRVPYQDAGAGLGGLVGRLLDQRLQLPQQGPARRGVSKHPSLCAPFPAPCPDASAHPSTLSQHHAR